MTDTFEQLLENDEDTLNNRYLTFSVENEMYGIEIRHVMEINGIQNITEMPEMPDYVKGIINLRGKIVPVMDIRLRFGKEPRQYDDRTCIIVIDFNGILVGLVVDAVAEVCDIHNENISERPNLGTRGSRGFVKNIGKINSNVILLLDCAKLLSSDEFDMLNEIL